MSICGASSTSEPLDVAPLAFGRTSAAALAHRRARDLDFLLRRLVDVHRPRHFFRHVPLGNSSDDDAAIAIVAAEELDDVAFANGSGRLHALPVDLHVTAATRLGGVAALLEEADELEPVIDSMSFHDFVILSREDGEGSGGLGRSSSLPGDSS